MNKDHTFAITTLTDYHLQDFIKCPYRFYFRHIEGKAPNQLDWRQVVQSIVNQVVSRYYKLPPISQTATKVLEFLYDHWKGIDIRLFESKLQYYTVLAKITDHLLKALTSQSIKYPPLFLYEKLKINVEELGANLSLTFEVAEWSNESFVIKKYLVDSNEEMRYLFKNLILVFCQKVFGQLPERIELISLMEGKTHSYRPDMNSVPDGLDYLNIIKNLMQAPKSYVETEFSTDCKSCPYHKLCDEGPNTQQEKLQH